MCPLQNRLVFQRFVTEWTATCGRCLTNVLRAIDEVVGHCGRPSKCFICVRLDYTPSSIFVRVIARPTYACRKCEQAALDPQFAKPAWPAEPVPRSGVGAGLLAQIIMSKYVDHLPLNRQEQIFDRHGWPRVKQSFAIHVDDSPMQLLKPDRTAYAWLTLGDAANPLHGLRLHRRPGRRHSAACAFGVSSLYPPKKLL